MANTCFNLKTHTHSQDYILLYRVVLQDLGGLPGGSVVKNLPAMQETLVWSLRQKDPLEKGMAAHSSILAWRIPWTEESDGLRSMGSQRVRHDCATNTFTIIGLNSFRDWGLPHLISVLIKTVISSVFGYVQQEMRVASASCVSGTKPNIQKAID